MRFRPNVSAVAAIAVLTATTFQLGGAALAHAPHSPLFGHHFVPPPPPPGPPTLKAVPTDNVKDFGAKGDGTTDDTAAINKAVTDAKANNKVVLFPAGKFFHTATLTFSGVAVTGVGSSSILLANPSNEENTAVILSGQSASITNMTVSTQGVVCGDDGFPEANEGAITISAATSFTVKNVTLVQGQNTTGVFVTGSNGGSVSAVSDNGFGSGVAPEAGVWIDNSSNVTVSGCLFQNQGVAINVTAQNGPTSNISIVSNTIGDTSTGFAIRNFAVNANSVNGLGIQGNTVQMANDNSGTAVFATTSCANVNIAQNNTYGGATGVALSGNTGTTAVVQNAIHNCGGAAVSSTNDATVQIASNAIGECGITDTGNHTTNAVILVQGTPTNTFVQNNQYQGHAQGLDDYVTSTSTAPHIPAANVTGNTQTQTALPNSI